MKKALAYMRLAFSDRLAYRGHFLAGSVLRFVSLIVVIYLWTAVFEASGRTMISGFRYGDMVAYAFLVMVSRSFASMPGLATTVAAEIREGTLSRFLVKPLGLLPTQLSLRFAHKAIFLASALVPFGVVAFFLRWAFPGWPGPGVLGAWILSLGLAFWIDFCLHFILGILAFWFLEVTSFLFIAMMIEYFCSGHMIPLDLLPAWLVPWLQILPYKYTAYFPAALFLGKIPAEEVPFELAREALWAAGLFAAAWFLLKRGEGRYSAYGG